MALILAPAPNTVWSVEPPALITYQPTGSHAVLDNITKKAARAANDDEARFDVVIIGPHEDTPTHFKLRGKNSVRKVLIAACKNFEVDPNWFLFPSPPTSEPFAE